MPDDPTQRHSPVRPLGPGGILAVVLVYATFAALWILVSDQAVAWLFSDRTVATLASTLKGWLFVGVTSMLLYGLIRRLIGVPAPAPATVPPEPIRPTLPFLLLAAAVVAFTTAAIVHTVDYQRDKEVARLQAIADLKAQQVTDWLKERQGDARFVQTNPVFITQYLQWRQAGDLGSFGRLQAQLEQLRRSRDIAAILLLGHDGELLWSSGDTPVRIDPALRDAARQAAADLQVHWVGPYLDPAGTSRLDFVAPLRAGAQSPLIVLHTAPDGGLYRTLQTWPVPSASGEILLFRHNGDQVLFFNRKDRTTQTRVPLATSNLLAGQVLRGEVRPGKLVRGKDYRGVDSLGVVEPIAGTDWFLIAKLDRGELYKEAIHDGIWIFLAGLLALFVAAAGAYLLRQRQQLALAASVQQAQTERISALQLLAAIADSSEDAIFAKDLAGRYTMVNQACCRFAGKSAEAMLGHNAQAVLSADQAATVMAGDRRVIADGHVIIEEFRYPATTGDRTFLTHKGPLRDADDRIIGIFGISRDITKHKEAETFLRGQAEELRIRNDELERFNQAMVGRELDMIALKQQVNEMARQLGQTPPYPLDFITPPEHGSGGPEGMTPP